jgi:hypothetical protein
MLVVYFFLYFIGDTLTSNDITYEVTSSNLSFFFGCPIICLSFFFDRPIICKTVNILTNCTTTLSVCSVLFGRLIAVVLKIRTLTCIFNTNKMNCELMLTYDTPALRKTGSRNLMGPRTLHTIWHTYMKLVTKYQIPVINSCWEKCDKKCAYTNVC